MRPPSRRCVVVRTSDRRVFSSFFDSLSESVFLPVLGVVADVPRNDVECAIVADDDVVVISLPSKERMQMFASFRDDRFVHTDDVASGRWVRHKPTIPGKNQNSMHMVRHDHKFTQRCIWIMNWDVGPTLMRDCTDFGMMHGCVHDSDKNVGMQMDVDGDEISSQT